jgi:hypothetical protein
MIILVSSVNKTGLDLSAIILERSLIYERKNKDPSIEPLGTPCLEEQFYCNALFCLPTLACHMIKLTGLYHLINCCNIPTAEPGSAGHST